MPGDGEWGARRRQGLLTGAGGQRCRRDLQSGGAQRRARQLHGLPQLYDGCPQSGAFSEGQFNIGTNSLGSCSVGATPNPSPSWPSDFVSGGIPNSTDKITITDLTSFLAPARRLDTSPGNPNFNQRWDLVPGRGLFANMININDLTALIAGTSGFPPMFSGAKAFNGPTCAEP